MSTTPITPAPAPLKLTLTPALIVQAIAFIVTQAIAYGILDPSTGQTIVSIGGIILPAAFALASSLHLGLVHSAVVKSASATGLKVLGDSQGGTVQR